MTSKLRIKGRILITGNIGLMSLMLATGIMLVICINFLVLFYELFLRQRLSGMFISYPVFTDLLAAIIIFAASVTAYCQIKLGSVRYFLRKGQKKGSDIRDIFYYFHPIRGYNALSFCVKLFILRAVCFAVSFLPFMLSLSALIHLLSQEISVLVAAAMVVGTVAFFISGAFFFSSVSSSFFLAKYYYVSGDYLNFSHLVSSSFENMRNNKKTLLRLRRSFAGWFFLCVLIIPAGYVWSYYNQTMAVAAAEFIEQ